MLQRCHSKEDFCFCVFCAALQEELSTACSAQNDDALACATVPLVSLLLNDTTALIFCNANSLRIVYEDLKIVFCNLSAISEFKHQLSRISPLLHS